ncbi:MAG: PadR family transcriptional regulator [Acidimicrobiaceae bacterium]|nr:PadR family transcriptional regulator [Acidimicrobiaceae bacterium]
MLNEREFSRSDRDTQGDARRRRGPGHMHGAHEGAMRGSLRRDLRRQRRGDVRAAVLVLLEEKPSNGYQLIQELSERSNETWRPSPGSIYPVLQQLEDEGLVEANASGTGRTYALTDAGRQLVNEQREQLGRPWENTDGGANVSARELMFTGRQVLLAARQVLVAGSETQVAKATTILSDARRALYGILAEGDQE